MYNNFFISSTSNGLSTTTIYSLKLTNDSGAPINLNKNSTAFLLPLLFHNQAILRISLLYSSTSICSCVRFVDVPINCPPPLLGKYSLENDVSLMKLIGSKPNIKAKSFIKTSGKLFLLLYVTTCANLIPFIYFLI